MFECVREDRVSVEGVAKGDGLPANVQFAALSASIHTSGLPCPCPSPG